MTNSVAMREHTVIQYMINWPHRGLLQPNYAWLLRIKLIYNPFAFHPLSTPTLATTLQLDLHKRTLDTKATPPYVSGCRVNSCTCQSYNKDINSINGYYCGHQLRGRKDGKLFVHMHTPWIMEVGCVILCQSVVMAESTLVSQVCRVLNWRKTVLL